MDGTVCFLVERVVEKLYDPERSDRRTMQSLLRRRNHHSVGSADGAGGFGRQQRFRRRGRLHGDSHEREPYLCRKRDGGDRGQRGLRHHRIQGSDPGGACHRPHYGGADRHDGNAVRKRNNKREVQRRRDDRHDDRKRHFGYSCNRGRQNLPYGVYLFSGAEGESRHERNQRYGRLQHGGRIPLPACHLCAFRPVREPHLYLQHRSTVRYARKLVADHSDRNQSDLRYCRNCRVPYGHRHDRFKRMEWRCRARTERTERYERNKRYERNGRSELRYGTSVSESGDRTFETERIAYLYLRNRRSVGQFSRELVAGDPGYGRQPLLGHAGYRHREHRNRHHCLFGVGHGYEAR